MRLLGVPPSEARLIRRRLGCPPPGKRAAAGAVGVALVEVSSVDGFQGREKETGFGVYKVCRAPLLPSSSS